jgi:hypothetical protein
MISLNALYPIEDIVLLTKYPIIVIPTTTFTTACKTDFARKPRIELNILNSSLEIEIEIVIIIAYCYYYHCGTKATYKP